MIEVYFGTCGRDNLLKTIFGDEFDRIEIKKGGKPFIRGGKEFNLSHSGSVSICAVSDKDIGVDIEKIKPRNIKRIVNAFSDEEKNRISGMRPEDGVKEFYRCWTAKEARAKLYGEGISRNLVRNFDYKKSDLVIISGLYSEEYVFSICCEKIDEVVFVNSKDLFDLF